MTRYCSIHKGRVIETDAEIIDAQEVGSGPPVPVYACRPCIRDRGLVPRPGFIGRQDAAPYRAQEAS
jgi:hypothetical protein